MQSSQHATNQDAASTEPKIRTFPSERRRAPVALAATFLILGGLVVLGVGGALALGPDHSPALAWYTRRAADIGVQPDALLSAGCALLAAGMVAFYLRRVAGVMLTPGAVEDALAEVGADMAEFRNKLFEFQNDHIHFHSQIESILCEVREHRSKDRSGEAVEALFRMAGSLDTLHARFDQRIGESERGLRESVSELGSLVEASRDFLQESLEQADQRIETLGAELELIQGQLVALVTTPAGDTAWSAATGEPDGEADPGESEDSLETGELDEAAGLDAPEEYSALGSDSLLDDELVDHVSLGLLDELDDCTLEEEDARLPLAAAPLDGPSSVEGLEPQPEAEPTPPADPEPAPPEPWLPPQVEAASPDETLAEGPPAASLPDLPPVLAPPAASEGNEPTVVKLDDDPPSALPAPAPDRPESRVEQMEEMLRDGTTAEMVEGLDLDEPQAQ